MEPKQKWTCWKEDGDLQMWACGNGESSYGVWFSDEQQAQAMCDELNNVERLRSQVEAMRVAGSAMQQVILDTMAFNKLPNPTLRPSQAVKDWTASLNPTPTTEAK